MRTHNNEINSVLLGIVDDLVDWGTEPNVRFKFECGPFFRRQELVQLLTAPCCSSCLRANAIPPDSTAQLPATGSGIVCWRCNDAFMAAASFAA